MRSRRSTPGKRIAPIVLVALVLIAVFGPGFSKSSKAEGGQLTVHWQTIMDWVEIVSNSYKEILNRGLPLLSYSMAGENPVDGDGQGLIRSAINTLANVDVNNPKTLLSSQMALLDSVFVAATDSLYSESSGLLDTEEDWVFMDQETQEPVEIPSLQDFNGPISLSGNKPLVAIYNTHNAETYLPNDGVEKIEGSNAGVVQVATELARVLEQEYGVKTFQSKTIHDYPRYEKSYGNAEKTVKQLLKENPSIQVVIDIHRDAGIKDRVVTTLAGGDKAAKIMLIVGTNARLPHPNWEANYSFAREVGHKMEELYPGLLKDVRKKEGRYNQHLHPRSLLVEVGSSKNSLEEAKEAVRAFAHVIYQVLKDIQQKSTF